MGSTTCAFPLSSIDHKHSGRDRRYGTYMVNKSALAFISAVMGNELDKIEQSGIQVAKHPKISQDVGQQLHVDVKVCSC